MKKNRNEEKRNFKKDGRVKDRLRGGYGDNIPDKQFNQKQLKKGIKVEMEHTNDRRLAKEIAKDHLVEIPNYYTYLDKMEKKAIKDHKKKHKKRMKKYRKKRRKR